jgi:hypothetical protein
MYEHFIPIIVDFMKITSVNDFKAIREITMSFMRNNIADDEVVQSLQNEGVNGIFILTFYDALFKFYKMVRQRVENEVDIQNVIRAMTASYPTDSVLIAAQQKLLNGLWTVYDQTRREELRQLSHIRNEWN